MNAFEDSRTLAVFIDLENVAIGVREAHIEVFDVKLVLERLIEKGNVVVKRAYADWARFDNYKRSFHEAVIELTEMPGSKLTGKNSADIKMVVDALELSFTKPHIDTFVLVSGDSDFSPLVSKLRENNRFTIGIGVKKSTSAMLVETCDEFIFYDDLVRQPKRRARRLKGVDAKKKEAFDLLLQAASALQRENKVLHGSLVKDTMKRLQPQFSEEYHGYSSFGRLLEDAVKQGLLTMEKDPRSGTWVIQDLTSGEADSD
ncbi:MAG: NYN domain-containing protein [Planctomycetes bacterium]|nr:NYN domain-containing protein [Planctomycetota bacterium]